ncbi:uncharacterized protein LOC132888110 isoform X2 [Neoarius graeffei]|uniref:uncharacterized protein LOC132888110 isoform X2 n=1 Tax=Neoarius graeffei TaxID=443677 RepID=UPI00298C63E2|nr:uncharacterized protein LOC132888110 isoform X2 [Neoarius graeffei]
METCLYLDATGGVVQKLPNQSKRVLYYALVLPGAGKDKPPLPVAELVTNSHTVPSISHWLMEFFRRMRQMTGRRVAQMETDYSWALINSVLLACNHEDISGYLDRTFSIVIGTGKQTPFIVLHLCSAHILKAVSQSFGRQTSDKGLKEYATYCFAFLLNCTTMQEALEVFYHMAVCFCAEQLTESVHNSKQYLDHCILKCEDLSFEDMYETEEKRTRNSSDPNKGILARSPFTAVFAQRREQAKCDVMCDQAVDEDNHYHCPGIIDVLLKTYMGIFSLWSGVLLGDLSRHIDGTTIGTGPYKTRDTNCHAELWFGLVKHRILGKKTHLRPAEFISKMFTSVQGRYVEHLMQHSLPMEILGGNLRSCLKSEDDPEEQWSKRATSSGSSKRKSKYFNPPTQLPKPKGKTVPNRKVKVEPKEVEDSQLDVLWKKRPTEVVVSVLPSQIKGRSIFVHHSELCSLKPHQWLTGEIIQALMHINAFALNVADRIYLMDHYTAGVILTGDRASVRRQSLPKVNFDNYEAIISFIHVRNNHWNALYIHANSARVFVCDPSPASNEHKDSCVAAQRIRWP